MRLIFLAALLLLSLNACSTGLGKKRSSCPAIACNVIAEETPWPTQVVNNGFKVKSGPWTFTLPPGPEKAITLQTVPVSIIQYANAKITFEYVDKAALAEYIEVNLDRSRYTVIDHPRIAYSSTPDQIEPKTSVDKKVLDWIFATKRLDMQYGGPAYVTRKGDITVYYGGKTTPSWDAHAIVTSSLFPDRYLKIQLQGLLKTDLEAIIASIN